jgi:type I restriction enzyme M protein
VQDILDNFEFRNQIPRLSKADALGTLIEKFTSADIDLSPNGLDNHGMGTVFEELVRRFNEENNEEAGEHWTPRDAVKLMAKLILLPVADEIESGTYLLYDGACGTGGMLTVPRFGLQPLPCRRSRCLLLAAARSCGHAVRRGQPATEGYRELARARCRRATSFTGGKRKNALPNCFSGEE